MIDDGPETKCEASNGKFVSETRKMHKYQNGRSKSCWCPFFVSKKLSSI